MPFSPLLARGRGSCGETLREDAHCTTDAQRAKSSPARPGRVPIIVAWYRGVSGCRDAASHRALGGGRWILMEEEIAVTEESAETPLPLSLLLADHVYHDRETGKWVVAGIFSSIAFSSLPRTYAQMEVFFQVTNVSRPVDLRVRMEHTEGDVVLDVGGEMKARSPLEVIAKRLVLRNLPFKRTGKYWVMLKSGEAILTQVPLYVGRIQKQQGQGGQSPPSPGDQGGQPE